jgi:hypothetical protein
MHYAIFFLLMICLGSTPAFANAGAPILLVFNGFFFAFGSIIIVAIESYFHWHILRQGWKRAFQEILIINIASTVIIGLGIPLLVAFIVPLIDGIIGFIMIRDSNLDTTSVAAIALSTWVFDFPLLTKAIPYMPVAMAFWNIICYIYSIKFESLLLQRLQNSTSPEVQKVTLYGNTASYALLGLCLIVASFFFYTHMK